MGIKKIKVKKVSPKEFANAMKKVGKALYKYTGAETMVTSGKALSKCKPKDAKCIAMNLGKLALSAKNFVPGAGMAAGIASTVAKNAIKEQIEKKVKAELAKKAAEKKLREAKSDEEKKAAEAELAKADSIIKSAEATIAVKEKEKADADTVVQQQAAAEKAMQAVEQAKLDPNTAKAAKQADKDIKAEIYKDDSKSDKKAGGNKILGIIGVILLILLSIVFTM